MAGRGDPCKLSLVTEGTVGTTPSRDTGGARSKSKGIPKGAPEPVPSGQPIPIFTVTIDGQPLDNTYQSFVQEVTIEEDADFGMDVMRLIISNNHTLYTDDPLWDEGREVELWMGTSGRGMIKKADKFISLGAKMVFEGSTDSSSVIVLTAVSQDMRLGRTEKRMVWKGMRDSEIVSKIAESYGWTADVEETRPIHPHVAQMGESDWKFLNRLARQHGFQLFLESSVLHFHAPRYTKPETQLIFFQGLNSQLSYFSVEKTVLQHGKQVVATQINPLSKESFQVTSNEKQDDVTKGQLGNFNGKSITSEALATLGLTQPQVYLVEDHHDQTRIGLGAEVLGISRSTRWILSGSGELEGTIEIAPRDTVSIVGCGRSSGEYYITAARHSINGVRFQTSFKCVRTWEGKSGESLGDSKSVDLESAGSVTL